MYLRMVISEDKFNFIAKTNWKYALLVRLELSHLCFHTIMTNSFRSYANHVGVGAIIFLLDLSVIFYAGIPSLYVQCWLHSTFISSFTDKNLVSLIHRRKLWLRGTLK